MPSENFIKTDKTVRYYLIGEPNNKIKSILFVLHGYGQLAKDFIQYFQIIQNENLLIVAPEAMNKFYLKGFTGKVGSTWMTKEDRNNEVKDYVNMLNKIYQNVISKVGNQNVKLNILGFSQGSHTSVRWLNISKVKASNIILWSGSLPLDVNYLENSEYWSNEKIYIILGNNDKFVSQEQFDEQRLIVKQNKLNLELIKFEGGHEIKSHTLQEINKKILV